MIFMNSVVVYEIGQNLKCIFIFLGVVIFLTIVLSVGIKEISELIKLHINATALHNLKKDNKLCNQKDNAKDNN